ncbi:hypothetical protein J2W98_005105 [Paenibacillus peoriae]|uniref:Uncharacterized protein n=1 Tax=Paenibacillus peoriae TaxID=59893 RepID=A0ABU1QMH6_9BACL|nr:hypothetical protein [Paenibacillus sp. PvR133]MDR6780797.1 hypothetical protein [Paenibacillus peoriae]
MSEFDGEYFAEVVIIVILVALFFYGSSDIEGLSAQPTQS